ncbi:hypothetical protein [Calidifontibacillus oryziterrae]|uniref:hypothetical protein n=1 Tax=Calidifontibacillus oryziterrae TaxID=1191699 RepID=UPI0012B50BCA|nr:hypothetical protein [Calidifontibacillus oryziterrae]
MIESQVESLLNTVLFESSVFDFSRMYLPQKLDLLVAIGVFSKSDVTYRKSSEMQIGPQESKTGSTSILRLNEMICSSLVHKRGIF